MKEKKKKKARGPRWVEDWFIPSHLLVKESTVRDATKGNVF